MATPCRNSSARSRVLPDLPDSLPAANRRVTASAMDPVLQATATAFGFVYVHPCQDGNGRLHRCLIHHVSVERQFTPPGMVFPVSGVMLDRIDGYRRAPQCHSGPPMVFIDWRSTADRNVGILNDTTGLFRYFDCRVGAESLYAGVTRPVEYDLPEEIDYLCRHDEAQRALWRRWKCLIDWCRT